MTPSDATAQSAIWPDTWSGCQLLAFSGLDGPTDWDDTICAAPLPDRIGVRFDSEPPVTLCLALAGEPDRPLGPDQLETCRIEHDVVALELRGGLSLRLGFVGDGQFLVEASGTDATTLVVELHGAGESHARAAEPGRPARGVVVNGSRRRGAETSGAVQRDCLPLSAEPVRWMLSFGPEQAAGGTWRSLAAVAESTLPPRLGRARAKALSILRGCVMAPEGPLRRRWMVSQREHHRAFNALHAPFYAQAVDAIDPTLGDDLIIGLLEQRGARGMVPARVWPRGRSGVCGPPLLAWAAWRRHCAGRGGPLEPLVPLLKAYVKYPLGARMLCRHGYARSRGARLLSWGLGDGSGMENSPRFEQGEPFCAVELNAYIVGELERLSQILAEVQPDSRESNHYAWLGEELSAEARAYFWDDQRGLFCDRFADDDPVPACTIAGLLPLFAGLADGPQAERLVAEQVSNPAAFWTPFPLASLSCGEPHFDQDRWRGAVWPGTNILMLDGLRRYGYHALADELRQRTIDELVRWFEATGTLWEYYDSAAVRSPADLPRGRRTGALPEYAWTAASLVMLLEEPS